ncbi:ricin B lectin domain-containing protein [Crucibulum laeve]|uniref:Ricin B lectin domain-containing protein n=1 Tax=Crucibulum laeve TaxID=68775 RepID=A0A5C3M2Q2_9AGAR|nr:ricin B lectin domain-containing protein [Crucibulum laeve]
MHCLSLLVPFLASSVALALTITTPVVASSRIVSPITITTAVPITATSDAVITTSSIPVLPTRTLHPNGNVNKCLVVRYGNIYNGVPVDIGDCGAGNSGWIFNKGTTVVQYGSTGYCLDAGSTPGNGVGMKLWQCYAGLAAQSWYYTADNRIALANQGLCLDLTNGSLQNFNQVQTWQCTDFNTNQIWTV